MLADGELFHFGGWRGRERDWKRLKGVLSLVHANCVGTGGTKKKMEKWTWEKKKNLEEQASGKGQIGGGEPDSRDQQQDGCTASACDSVGC